MRKEDCVVVSVPAHLHIGNYELSYKFGRILGTLGITIAYPRTVIEACPFSEVVVDGPGADLIHHFIGKLGAKYGVHVRVREAIPRGVGLGGTTALALATVVVLAAQEDKVLTVVDVEKAASHLGRLKWSSLGLYSFLYGGFIADTGRRPDRHPRLLLHYPIPPQWRVVVVVLEDHVERIRRLKQREDEILESLEKAPDEYTARVARTALSGIMACIVEEDYNCFVESIAEYNRVLGEYWMRHGQETTYCCNEAEELYQLLYESHRIPLLQSSWGPTLWTIVENRWRAQHVYETVVNWVQKRGIKATVWITRPDNHGAVVIPGNVVGWKARNPVQGCKTP